MKETTNNRYWVGCGETEISFTVGGNGELTMAHIMNSLLPNSDLN